MECLEFKKLLTESQVLKLMDTFKRHGRLRIFSNALWRFLAMGKHLLIRNSGKIYRMFSWVVFPGNLSWHYNTTIVPKQMRTAKRILTCYHSPRTTISFSYSKYSLFIYIFGYSYHLAYAIQPITLKPLAFPSRNMFLMVLGNPSRGFWLLIHTLTKINI